MVLNDLGASELRGNNVKAQKSPWQCSLVQNEHFYLLTRGTDTLIDIWILSELKASWSLNLNESGIVFYTIQYSQYIYIHIPYVYIQ